ncbi:hypothetical protein [Pseudonocardia alaniniphila]|uniref:TCP-1/cpn60 chaperonin family protein n=1 Tax=Pseudonocardia alaniniphila TaxID=75291 RepID=A0ABS9TUG2_9PSEU|nr:hypothetical protein [Pseudonocardia alaniniphila]MCH6172195.1 hypothetical protein [Pseudonocardia alaniniphila]
MSGWRTLLEGLGLHGAEAAGANFVKVALEAPLKQIAFNAGLESGVVGEEVRGGPRAHRRRGPRRRYAPAL